ncbi:Bug family tripartite tricarboxylate transporter substrate binding protein [Cupriavidus consociatus]|uniref:Bug family tripartite tricarboxylate transporter substrate binding protein n=1 Tax=Cupriavidus consociatus TaxID=2821357 RepID=UPI001AEB37C6|nr:MULTISPECIES: tripartite tricarboxylate transporter substrate binding protein [unclassified Cupriavidus]MBP0621367.1 tripartite tricarboxylate transporter substrate binding protein [Cupriavidus sp. LEh25]MDK2658040.1 tripartite tricarboxylate transporter substrate binding protein [Cupriavidus sp. LEh21]
MNRRQFSLAACARAAGMALGVAGIGAATLFAAPAAHADAWPSKPVTVIVPFPAGGGTDAFARPLTAQLSKQLGKQFVIDNRGGAGGTVGASVAAKAAPDGYTVFIGGAHHAIAPSFYKKLDYDIEKDFIPVTVIAQPPQVVVVNPNRVKANTLQELIAYARANPGKLNYGSAGNGSAHHLAGELFKIQTKTFITHIPYKGAGPALSDLIAGQVDLMFDGLGSSAQHIRAGRIKALAVASSKRSAAFPNVPTAAEAGVPNYEVSTWYAMWVPKGTPKEIVERLYAETEKALNTPEIKQVWLNNGSETPVFTQEQFAQFQRAEIRRWAQVVQQSGAKMD